jgi:Protein of unknown function (DUF2949)
MRAGLGHLGEVRKSMAPAIYHQFLQFLEEELKLSADSISIALRHPENEPALMPMILWQYGLITLDQLNKIFDWMEQA